MATTNVSANAHKGEGEFEITILRVEEGTGEYKGRINFVTDTQLVYLDQTGNESTTDTFSLAAFAAKQQLSTVCKPYNLQLMIANGNLEAGDTGLFLYNTKMKIKRTFVAGGTPRRYGEGNYERDTYVTDIISAEKTKDIDALAMLASAIRERKAMAAMTIANPFGF